MLQVRHDQTRAHVKNNNEGFKCRWEQFDQNKGACKPDVNNFDKGAAASHTIIQQNVSEVHSQLPVDGRPIRKAEIIKR